MHEHTSPAATQAPATIQLSNVMRQRIATEGLDEQAVREHSCRFVEIMGQDNITPDQQTAALQLLDTGLVDLGLRHGAESILLWNGINADPGFCFARLYSDPAFQETSGALTGQVIGPRAQIREWDNLFLAMIEIPSLKRDAVQYATEYFVITHTPRRENPTLAKALYTHRASLGEHFQSELIKSFIREGFSASVNAWLASGWEPDEAALRKAMEGENPCYPALLATGMNVDIPPHSETVMVKGAGTLRAYIADQRERWENVQAKLEKCEVNTLDAADLLAAAHMGDEALIQFMHPKSWRVHSAHLQELLDTAPIQIQNRIQRACPLACQAMQQRVANHTERLANSAWGRG